MEYKFDMEPDFENGEDYQDKDDNIIEVKVFDNKTGKEIKGCYVTLFLSKNGMIGMGKNLIRYAQDFHEGRHVHLDPPESKDLLVERLGVFPTTVSTPAIIGCSEFGTIDEAVISKLKD